MMRFIASDERAARDKARRALGDKAVIVSMRTLPSGDVEVTASDRPAPAAPPEPVAAVAAPSFGAAARDAIEVDTRARASGSRLNEAIEQRFSEHALSQLRSNLSSRAAGPVAREFLEGRSRGLQEALARHGLNDGLLAALTAAAARCSVDDDYICLETAFAGAFSYAPIAFAATAPIMLVGPTGAGKTSCAAKLAKSAVDAGAGAFLMTADVGRAGAIEQMQTYSDRLGTEYAIVETPADAAAALNRIRMRLRPDAAVILDTPGISPFDGGDVAALRSFQDATHAEPVLVLPASGDREEFAEWATAFAEFGVRRAIITKFDATKRVGAGLSAAHAAKLMLAQLSETAFISEGLLPAGPEFLARRFLATRPGAVR